ncbi:Nucleoside-diphosphate-sugar epimerase [Cupriavidus necator]|uniref:NAD(P)-dependent oxidoreductase n=1 Tax=Cupriavidus necator (strain ATCC 17699 / DSM 428 / KCTC 22496 / NCIMB 10442 / H16 / Stanier 337) TaxID=381666 RepID=Q0K7Q0_CUPNH|nr:NAD(P)-dependent oxidoreductase [Cupriavidus necator]QCC01740.1 NAD(P)-dependent oxidoreductase [Cupriavidus necator H16]QQB75429.1 NAD-dependent epimerase/dehydratase family protein [Cupriavidus necator]WKA40139.1 NAD(P)-dependent oxidoreductase [Cupriavidus necator]CAJ93971.1 Nucleoside-diphosphate-sugar epimerase [Cupriavidus necator H16]
MKFVIGAGGRLGQALTALYREDNVVVVDRQCYRDWWQDGSQAAISRYFEQWSGVDSTIFIAAGILDPKISGEDHLRVNFLLPKHLIEGTAQAGMRVVTFGTVMEKLIANQNPYIHSKAMLGQYVAERADRLAHLRVHTLYGIGQPSPFMFLGQICQALRQQTPFEMSPGNQLREYHHIEDEVRAIATLVEQRSSGVIDLSHGQPVRLKDLATHVFRSFDAESLLRIGALPDPGDENYQTFFERPKSLQNIRFRETLPSVVDYLKACSLGWEVA